MEPKLKREKRSREETRSHTAQVGWVKKRYTKNSQNQPRKTPRDRLCKRAKQKRVVKVLANIRT
jgi:hypothetical protein